MTHTEEQIKEERERLLYDQAKDDRIKELEEALKGVKSECDNQNPTHENIWRIANAVV